jgi:hypothetical protein
LHPSLRSAPWTTLVACLACSSAWGRGASPYLPLNLSPEIERQIERVLILADKPVMTRPIAAAVVLDALPAACKVDQVLCTRVRKFLQRYTRKAAIDHAAFGFVGTEGSTTALANQRGQDSDSSYHASLHAYAQLNDYAIISVGAFAYDGDISPTGSMLSLGWDLAQLDVGFRDHWFSPFTGSSMLISTQAETLPSVTLSNYRPLTRLGFQYEVFLAELSNSDRILFADEDGLTSGKPRLAGLHIGIEPAVGWSLAFNRLLQFGGGQRGGTGISDFFRALINPSQNDNVANAATDEQFGNQVASITSSFIFPGRVPFAAYIEYAGEDSSFEGNYRLGNAALSLGLRFPQLWQGIDLTFEVSEWQNGWYVNGVYGDGLTNEGNVLGHFGGDHRLFNDAVGAQSQFIRLGWEPRFGGAFDFTARTVRNDNSRAVRPLDLNGRPVRYERAYDVGVAYSRPLRGFSVGAEFLVGKDVFGDSFSRIGGYMRFTDEFGLGGGSRRGFTEPPRRQRGAELFFDAGVNLSSVNKRLDGNAVRERTGMEVAPHVAIGARRQVSERSDLGVRLEFDRVDDAMLLAARLVDYRYRFRGPLAVGAFFGAARYDLATPAYGYYFGAGVQWRNLLPNTDLSLDFRYGDKIARDKLLESDPPSNQRPDAFFDISGATFGLSYRW